MHEGSVAWSRASVLAVSVVVAGLALIALASQSRVRPPAEPQSGASAVRVAGPGLPIAEPQADAVVPDAATQARELREGRPIDLNLATVDELRLLPGIGPTLATRIVQSRSEKGAFPSVDQITRVRGIGPKTLARVKSLLTTEGQSGKSQPSESVTAK